MQCAVDEKKKLELRVDNTSGELNKARAKVTELEGNKQQLQVGLNSAVCQAAAGRPSAPLA
jgi:phage shock protein A